MLHEPAQKTSNSRIGLVEQEVNMRKSLKTPWMDRALTPRDQDGKIQPMVWPGGTGPNGRPMYFPVLPPSKDPMLFEEDFKPGGKYYSEVSYHPGLYAASLGIADDGNEIPLDLSQIRYLPQVYNLPSMAEDIQKNGIPDAMRNAASQVFQALAKQGFQAARGIEEPPQDSREGLYLPNSKGKRVRICNSDLRVQRLFTYIDNREESFAAEILLVRNGETVTVPVAEIDHLESFLSTNFPWFHLSEASNAAALLNAYIRDQLEAAPKHTILKRLGWKTLGGQHIYVHDGLPSTEGLSFACGHKIEADPQLTPAEAFRSALNSLGVGKLDVTLPLFLTAILGPLVPLFQEAECPPRFCLFLHGPSGSLKTATARVFCQLFEHLDIATFRDTEAAIDVSIANHRHQVLLLDDFQPPVCAAEGRDLRKKLEHALRLFGDRVAKKRSNSTATAVKGSSPCGTCIITGESTAGSYSSLLRCVLVPIQRGDIDGERLRVYQEAPMLWTSNFTHFLSWVGRGWDELAGRIQANFLELRRHFSAYTKEPRLADAGAVLMLTGGIVLRYGVACGGIAELDRQNYWDAWEGILQNLLTASASDSQEVDAVALSKDALAGAYTSGRLKIAPDVGNFRPDMDGFFASDRLWVHQKSFARVLRERCAEIHAPCVTSLQEILPQLFANGILIRDNEKGKNSYLKRAPEIPGLAVRPRMICFIRRMVFQDE